VVRRNAALLPAYTLLLGLIALLGLMALAAGVKPPTPNDAVPELFLKMFPDWFAGFCFAAVAIGALVPAAIMSIAAANTFTRNIYRQYIRPGCTPQQEASTAKLVSLVVKIGALAFIIFLPLQYGFCCKCSAAYGSSRPSLRLSSASSPDGFTIALFSRAGLWG
jgi:SSS family solute:Na+ symporter